VPSRAHLYVNVAIAAVAAAGIVVGLTLDTRTTPVQPRANPGKPPVPTGLTGPAGRQIEAAFREWPHGSIDALQRLGLEYEGSAIVQFYRGIALLWAGYPSDAETALESAKQLGRNTLIQGRADNILHPEYYQPTSGPSYPVFIPTVGNALLRQGSKLQIEGHQISAEHLYQRAALKQPGNVQALVAEAVGLFDEDNLTPTFSRLGPLTQRFPRSQIVRYYLGYLLAWTAQRQEAITQFEKTVELGPNTEFGKAARHFLEGIASAARSSTPTG
jgi:tetratricopeptide (TPR) repeat protein